MSLKILTMNILKIILLLLAVGGITLFADAQAENKFIRRGNDAFKEGDFKKAEIDYRKALEKNQNSTKSEFNLGGAMYEQKSYDEATKTYEKLSTSNLSPLQKAGTYHNLGNSLLQSQKFEPAIEAYKNALRNNPNDEDTKYNLEYARRMLKQQQQQQQNKDQNQDQNKDQNQDQKQDQKQDQQQDQKQDQKQDQQQNQNQQNKNDQQQQPQQGQMKQISKEDAERMLQALKDNEKKTLEKIRLEKLKNAKKIKSEKDW